jgi:LysM repeat protein
MRRTIITLVVSVAILVPGIVHADGMPPGTDTAPAKVADPSKVTMSDLAADAPSDYTVVKGDTLWGIASRFLKDPWKWPQIWEMNRDEIKNPHWIYPGNVIHLDKSGANPRLSVSGSAAAVSAGPSGGTEAQAQANVVHVDPRTRTEPLELAVPSIPGSAIGPFLTQPMVVEAGSLDNTPTVLATEESRVIVGEGDTMYADRIGTADGVNWQVFRPGEAVHDPDTGELLGYEAKYLGDARVKRFGNPTTLAITKAREEINRGDRLMPARESSFPSYMPHAPDKPIRGVIMSVDGGVSELGQFRIVTINRGARDGIEVGHVLASYHRGAIVSPGGTTHDSDLALGFQTPGWLAKLTGSAPAHPTNAPATDDQPAGATLAGSTLQIPDERNGLVFVFRVFEKMSYAIVMRATKPLYVGDVVQTP